jgi:MOSC domain-containing protein YiiM
VTERKGAGKNPHDRALLFQTDTSLALLAQCVPTEVRATLLEPASFGENILLSELSPAQLCVGDILTVTREGATVLICQVTSPRWPCYKVDKKHSRPLDALGTESRVRGICCATGLAGFFAKVIEPGSIAPGDSIAVTSRPQPQWTLERVSNLLYGGVNRRTAMLDVWNGTEQELHQCLELTELAEFEWRDRLKQYVTRRAEQRRKRQEKLTRIAAYGGASVIALLAVLYAWHLRRIVV